MAWGGSKKAKQSTGEPVTLASEQAATHASQIGRQTRIEGKLSAEEDLAIAGVVEGDIACERTVRVVASGKVAGNIDATAIVITGTVEGNVWASEMITIADTGRLIGDLHTPCFDHQPGGFFQGYAHMTSEPAPPPDEPKDRPKENETRETGDENGEQT